LADCGRPEKRPLPLSLSSLQDRGGRASVFLPGLGEKKEGRQTAINFVKRDLLGEREREGDGEKNRERERESCAVGVAYVSLRTFSILQATKDISVRASTVTAVIRLRCRVKKVRGTVVTNNAEAPATPGWSGPPNKLNEHEVRQRRPSRAQFQID